MKSKTKISKQEKRKTNSELVETIRLAKKNKNWEEVASLASSPRRKRKEINISEIEKESKGNETIVVVGKVLGQGDISKKIKVAAISFSESAREKLKSSGVDTLSIMEEIKKNPDAKGVKIVK